MRMLMQQVVIPNNIEGAVDARVDGQPELTHSGTGDVRVPQTFQCRHAFSTKKSLCHLRDQLQSMRPGQVTAWLSHLYVRVQGTFKVHRPAIYNRSHCACSNDFINNALFQTDPINKKNWSDIA
ncbi:hypothetical protein EVAR_42450_1 [Eumeta japonica]|uniref:Uncharacterized protein n=1 Tax=Eumeta variegata TaxID=151549 RepID=A0A4C1Y1S7_EUMVA|nr:hypothetical protein EVAR_42450_1 [Eumeta japonica]